MGRSIHHARVYRKPSMLMRTDPITHGEGDEAAVAGGEAS